MERLTEMWEEKGQKYGCFTPCKKKCLNDHKPSCNCDVVVNVMKRLALYEDTGLTPEHVLELKEKATPKHPSDYDEDFGYFKCGSCGELITWTAGKDDHKFCLECGQAIDWKTCE